MTDDPQDDDAGSRTRADAGDDGDRTIGTSESEPVTTRTTAVRTDAARKSSPIRWMFDDLGLKVVALVLAITTWILVHDQLRVERSVVGVAVVCDDVPAHIRADVASLPLVTVRLVGTAAAVERARQGLEQTGHPVRIRLRELAGDDGQATFSDANDFTFPFPDAGIVVEAISPPVRVPWHRVESQEFEYEKPRVDLGARSDLELVAAQSSVEPAKVMVTGPVSVLASLRNGDVKLVPDEVSAVKWLRTAPDFATPFPWSSGFAAWRSRAPELRAEWCLSIEPATVGGKTKLRENRTTTTKVELALLYPAGSDARVYEKYDVKILDTGYDPRTHQMEISVRGDPALVASLGTGQSGWTLVLNLPPPPKDDSATVENFPATLTLVAPESAVGETSPRLRLVTPQKVFVTIEKRKGP